MIPRVVLLLAICLSLTAPAQADQVYVRDPKDFRGDVDIKRAAHGHGRDHQVLQHRIRTYDAWKSSRLRHRGKRIDFFFNVDGDNAIERHVTVRYVHGRLEATMYAGKLGRREVGRVNVWRRDRRGLAVSFPVALLGTDVQRYQWEAQSRFKTCPDFSDYSIPPCYDFAPNRGRVTHRL